MIKARGTTNSSVIQSFRKNPSATCSKQSARYIGLRVKRNGPLRTIVNAGLDGLTFVPAAFIATWADPASVGAKMTRTIPHTSQINGGNAITPGLSDDVSDSAIVRRRRLPGDERFSTSLKRIWKPGKDNH